MQFLTIQELDEHVPADERGFMEMTVEEQRDLMLEIASSGYRWDMADGGVIIFEDATEYETWQNQVYLKAVDFLPDVDVDQERADTGASEDAAIENLAPWCADYVYIYIDEGYMVFESRDDAREFRRRHDLA